MFQFCTSLEMATFQTFLKGWPKQGSLLANYCRDLRGTSCPPHPCRAACINSLGKKLVGFGVE
jgi:hypothetical protein